MRRRAARRLSVARRATATLGGVALVVSSLLLTPPSAVADRSDPTTQRAVGLADPESGRGFWKFEYTGGPQTFTVPSGVNSIVIVASGGTGRKGSHIRGASSAPGGIGATTLSSHRVAPGDVLTVWVGGEGEDDGGWGYGCGGSSGKAGPGTWDLSPGGHGGGGGGASAVTAHAPDAAADDCDPSHRPTGSSVLAVAGGGGGGGGAGSQWVDPKGQTSIDISNATRGGAGGDPAGAGEQAPPPASGGVWRL